MTIADVVPWSQALMTPVIAALGAYIAWLNWRAAKTKLQLDRYERRVAVYGEVKKILSLIMREADVTSDELLRFRSNVAEADFIFGGDIPEYVDEIYKCGLKLWRTNAQYRAHIERRKFGENDPPDYNHDRVCTEMHDALTWLTDQIAAMKDKFKPYLNIAG